MSKSILDHITYNRQRYHETNDPIAQQAIMDMAQKLSHLQNQIIQHPEGRIHINYSQPSKYLVSGFKDAMLTRTLSDLVHKD